MAVRKLKEWIIFLCIKFYIKYDTQTKFPISYLNRIIQTSNNTRHKV